MKTKPNSKPTNFTESDQVIQDLCHEPKPLFSRMASVAKRIMKFLMLTIGALAVLTIMLVALSIDWNNSRYENKQFIVEFISTGT